MSCCGHGSHSPISASSASSRRAPGGRDAGSTNLSASANYRFADTPGDPVLLHLGKVVIGDKGDRREGRRASDVKCWPTLTFSEAEFQFRDLLARAMGNGGLDPARDIEAIAVNRWSHGYSYEYMRPWDTYWPEGRLPIDDRAPRMGAYRHRELGFGRLRLRPFRDRSGGKGGPGIAGDG